MSARWCLLLGALFGGLGVGTGAFAAHGLSGYFQTKYADQTRVVAGETVPLARKYLADFKTGAEYQLTHALALLAAGLLADRRPSRWCRIAGISFTLGILLFSGSLYALTLLGVPVLGAITPLGGVAFLVGWGSLAMAAFEVRTTLPDPAL